MRTTVALGAACVSLLAFAGPAQADFVVDDLDETSDETFDGVCDATAGDTCTLQAAIEEANFTVGPDTITFSVTGVHNITSEMIINTPMTIDGNGSGVAGTVIDANDASRLFRVTNAATPSVGFTDLRLEDGHQVLPGIGNGGAAIQSDTSLSLDNVTANSNNVDGTGQGHGGAIFATDNAETVSLTDSTVSGNTINSTAQNSGAGIETGTSSLILTRTTISGNSITAGTATSGGGIVANGALTIVDSTINGNSISSGMFGTFGGGISSANSAAKTITNSTISGNTAGDGASGQGGGAAFSGSATLTNVTLAANSAASVGQDLLSDSGALVTLKNTILGTPGSCGTGTGSFASGTPGHNIDVGTSCGLGTANGNQENTDPQLVGLALNPPGTTATHALQPTSPAIDAGAPTGLATDQRGVARPQGTLCDVGAFELEAGNDSASCAGPPPPELTPPAFTPSPTPVATPSTPAPKKCKRKAKKRAGAAKNKKCKK